jgi:hypothetical protein
MITSTSPKPVWLNTLRLTARIIALLFVIILFLIFIGKDMSPIIRLTQLYEKPYLMMCLWFLTPIGYLIGLWKERTGGLLSLVSTLTHMVFLSREGFGNTIHIIYIFLCILIIPSILYLLYWYLNRTIKAESISD